ncbi:hypothetical protein O9993_12040 [Vibrio lentus]|nr:hypothetical protein [Vibrio lentus]
MDWLTCLPRTPISCIGLRSVVAGGPEDMVLAREFSNGRVLYIALISTVRI